MGLQIGDIVPRGDVKFEDLKGKIIAVDAFNAIYQFLSSIRQPDGTPLMDSQNRITSHLSGLFYRNIALLAEGMKLIYVFDGEYNPLKNKTHEKRNEAKEQAMENFRTAKEEEDIEAMGKYARGFSRITPEMLQESKDLLTALGVGVVQAASEGEMQAADLVKRGQAYAVGSQDYDAIVVGGTRLIQNLTLARRRKTPTGFVYIAPEMIEYERVLTHLGIDGDQLICLAILVGTDFNPGGIRGIGPKKALTLVRQKKFPVAIFQEVEEIYGSNFNWQDIFQIFKRPKVNIVDDVEFPKLNVDKIKEILVKEHDFSEDRVDRQLGKLKDLKKMEGQTKLF